MTFKNFGVITTPTNRQKSKKEESALEQNGGQLLKLETNMKFACLMESLMLCRTTKPSLINDSDILKKKYQKSKWRTNIITKFKNT
jgi:hypothetical protein